MLNHVEAVDMASGFRRLLDDQVAAKTTLQALEYLHQLFEAVDTAGSRMAGRNVEGIGDPAFVSAAVTALAADLLDELSA